MDRGRGAGNARQLRVIVSEYTSYAVRFLRVDVFLRSPFPNVVHVCANKNIRYYRLLEEAFYYLKTLYGLTFTTFET